MGVTGLWTVVAPTARPTKLETLNRKRLAVDASIWIYQFLKAVRDKEGNALRNSHVVGFFRRICKLLYFGIKPVFIFDGGAPALKRETIRARARRREGRRDDATRTASKLLAVQVARAAEEEAARRKADRERTPLEEELPDEKDLVYVDEIGMDKKEREKGRGFRKTDQYHLPDLDVSIADMGAPNDPRIMSQAELEDYARQFHSGEDINLYDFSNIDFESPFFLSLPPGDRYNILNAARLRSRLRMGYSKEQLDGMFPDRMAFSKFQIERVRERNELTQRLMHISGMVDDDFNIGGRIAGEKGKEYVLVKNDGVEGGWALGVVSNKHGTRAENAIDLEKDYGDNETDAEPSDEDEEFEDVAIEGLNRIPSAWKRKRHQVREVDYDISYEQAAEEIAKKRKSVYEARKKAADEAAKQPQLPAPKAKSTAPQTEITAENELFVDQTADDVDELFEDVDIEAAVNEEEDELQKAIALSLEQPEEEGDQVQGHQSGVDAEGADDDFNLQAALAESRSSKYKSKTSVRSRSPEKQQTSAGFDGPLPFKSLNLGQSLLGKKRAREVEQNLSGGFERGLGEDTFRKQKEAQPTPAWFEAAPTTDDMRPNIEQGNETSVHIPTRLQELDRPPKIPKLSREVIDIDNEEPQPRSGQIIIIEDDDELEKPPADEDWNMVDPKEAELDAEAQRRALEADARREAREKDLADEREKRYEMARKIAAENEDPISTGGEEHAREKQSGTGESLPSPAATGTSEHPNGPASEAADDVEWSDSDTETARLTQPLSIQNKTVTNGKQALEEDDDIFEDVDMQAAPSTQPQTLVSATKPLSPKRPQPIEEDLFLPENEADHEAEGPDQQPQPDLMDGYDSDEELMRQLAIEAEEHARFASSLAPKTIDPDQARRDYESELASLRQQQKKDRRDADEVTQTMIQECQALLRLFGLPYITAPMEAEAQCAELVSLGLVDGIVTDDSDIFLFGGTRIYKNMFNTAKFVECYLASDLEKEYALDRHKLIRFAHLLGSDYTEGIPGVGPVTALEIISDFSDLVEFKDWTKKIQLGEQTPSVMEGNLNTAFKRKFKRTVQKKLFLPTTFPDARVDQAYLEPEVDSNNEPFQWGVPDLDRLRSFLMATIGWSSERTDEILVPVIRDMNKRESEGTQANLTRFFAGGVGVGATTQFRHAGGGSAKSGQEAEGTAPRNRTGKESGRMKNAYSRLRGEAEKRKRAALQQDSNGDTTADSESGMVEENGENHAEAEDNTDESNGIHEDGITSRHFKTAKTKKRKPAAKQNRSKKGAT